MGGGGLSDLAKTMVSAVHIEQEYKVEKLRDKKFEVTHPRIKYKSHLQTRERTVPDQYKWSFTVVIDR